MNKEIKKLMALKKKYIKALTHLARFNASIITDLGSEEIRGTSEFFDCEITLVDMIQEKIISLNWKIDEIQACNLAGTKIDF